MNKKVSVSVALAITLIAMTVTFSITMILSMNIFDRAVNDVTEKQAQYSAIAEMDTYIRANYYGDIDDEYMTDAISRGFISGLDSDSSYYTAAEYAVLQGIENGSLVSIGIVAQKDAGSGNFRILKVHAGSPAESAGLSTYMYITAVDDTPARSMAGSGALNSRLRGAPGTQVTVVCQDLMGEELTFTIPRQNYTAPTVESHILDGYAYIRIWSFSERTASQFDYAVREAVNAEVKGFIFDLRGTSSGSIEYSYEMIDQLCPLGTVAKTLLKSGVKQVQRMSDAENYVDLPMVCLVNESTAGTAELFAACVRDLAGGQIVGVNTQGKGTLQSVYQFTNGSAISLTYAELLTGNDENEYSFNGVGLAPDIEVEANYDTDIVLYTPRLDTDNQLYRSLEVVRSMARAAGLETNEAGTEEQGGEGQEPVDNGEETSIVPENGESGSDEPENGGDSSSAAGEPEPGAE